MKVGFALYDGFSALDFAALYDPLASQGFEWDACAMTSDVHDAQGLHFYPTRIASDLSGYEMIVVPGGRGALERLGQANLAGWLATAAEVGCLSAVAEGILLLAAAGLAHGRRVSARVEWGELLAEYGAVPVFEPLVFDGPLATACTPTAALDLAVKLCEMQFGRTAGETTRQMLAMDHLVMDHPTLPIPRTGQSAEITARRATLDRKTGETQVEVRLDIDGAGRHQIDTGLPFLDHMLAQIAVHGLFDLYIQAKGDLQIDPHHTLEDVALTVGSAFQQALGDRAGIVRMASADCPMDESLAWVAVDFSGRPYSVIQAEWHGSSIGGLPVSLFAHFFESFAINARCNLHASVRYGRDDHHQAEALFKAFGRALCAATRIDPRRVGQVPSSKGILF